MNTENPIKLKLDRFVFETGVHNDKNGFWVVFPYNTKLTSAHKSSMKAYRGKIIKNGR